MGRRVLKFDGPSGRGLGGGFAAIFKGGAASAAGCVEGLHRLAQGATAALPLRVVVAPCGRNIYRRLRRPLTADISLFKKIHQEGPGQFQNLFSLVPHSQRSPSLARHEKEGKRKPSRETRYFCFRDSRGRCRLSMMSFDIRVSIITKKQKKGTLFSSPDKNKRKESPRSRGRILPFPYEIVSVC